MPAVTTGQSAPVGAAALDPVCQRSRLADNVPRLRRHAAINGCCSATSPVFDSTSTVGAASASDSDLRLEESAAAKEEAAEDSEGQRTDSLFRREATSDRRQERVSDAVSDSSSSAATAPSCGISRMEGEEEIERSDLREECPVVEAMHGTSDAEVIMDPYGLDGCSECGRSRSGRRNSGYLFNIENHRGRHQHVQTAVQIPGSLVHLQNMLTPCYDPGMLCHHHHHQTAFTAIRPHHQPLYAPFQTGAFYPFQVTFNAPQSSGGLTQASPFDHQYITVPFLDSSSSSSYEVPFLYVDSKGYTLLSSANLPNHSFVTSTDPGQFLVGHGLPCTQSYLHATEPGSLCPALVTTNHQCCVECQSLLGSTRAQPSTHKSVQVDCPDLCASCHGGTPGEPEELQDLEANAIISGDGMAVDPGHSNDGQDIFLTQDKTEDLLFTGEFCQTDNQAQSELGDSQLREERCPSGNHYDMYNGLANGVYVGDGELGICGDFEPLSTYEGYRAEDTAPYTEDVAVTAETRATDTYSSGISSCTSMQGDSDQKSIQCPAHVEEKQVVSQSAKRDASPKSWASLFKADASHSARDKPQQSSLVKQEPSTVDMVSNLMAQTSIQTRAQVQGTPAAEEGVIAVRNSKAAPAENESNVNYILGMHLRKFECRLSAPALTPRGFLNSRNYCYINCVMQSLLACPLFYNFINRLPQALVTGSQSKANSVRSGNLREVTVELPVQHNLPVPQFLSNIKMIFNHFMPMFRPDNRGSRAPNASRDLVIGLPLNILAFHHLADMFMNNSVQGRQEDAHEFLCRLLQELNAECSSCIKLTYPSNSCINGFEKEENCGKRQDDMPEENEDDSEWQEYYGRKIHLHREVTIEDSPISEIFGGCLRTTLEKPGVNRPVNSSNIEPFYSLSLDVESPSILQALKNMGSRTSVMGLLHPTTKQPVRGYQTMLIERLPPCLILHLKCFSWKDGQKKISQRQVIPVDLNIPNEIMSKTSCSSSAYKLFAIIHHKGTSINSGHYICDAFHPGFKGWLRCDDRTITPVHSRDVLPREAGNVPSRHRDLTPFILFYRQAEFGHL